MRIGLVSPYSWSVPGGVNEHVRSLAVQLEQQGHEAWIIAPSGTMGRKNTAPPVDRFITVGGAVSVHSNGSKAHVNAWPLMVQRMERILEDGEFDLIHAHEPCTPSVAASAVLAASVPVVGTFHRSGGSTLAYRMFLPVARRVVERLAVRISVSPFARDYAAEVFPGDYRIIPNGVNLEDFSPAREIAPVRGRVLFVGRADRRKGLTILLEAFNDLRERLPWATLEVVGSTSRDLESAADRGSSRLSWPLPGVTALGRVPLARKVEAMGQAEVLAVPSLGGESFGIVLVEGLAAGVPIVASDIEAYRAVLGDGRLGALVPPGDAVLLSEQLEHMLTRPGLARGYAARGVVGVEEFAWPTVADAIVQTYQEALSGVSSQLPLAWEHTGARVAGRATAEGRLGNVAATEGSH